MQEFATGKVSALGRTFYQLTCFVFKNRQAARIMKLTSILLLAGCLQLSAKGITQTVSITVKDAPLLTVLKAIEKQTDYLFFVNNQQLQKAKKVTITANNLPLQQVLDLCFKDQPLTYIILGKVINVIPKQQTGKNNIDISENVTNIDVKGKVVDSKGAPVANATVSVQGTSKTTITNANGEFSLVGIDEDAVIVITHVQFETENIVLNGHSIVNATLQIKISSLDEMQVIAYGTTTKRLNTGSVSTVKSEDIQRQPVNNPLLALQGRVPGMDIVQTNGIPGGVVKVRIRGQNSLANSNLPLYIIDGVPYISENLPNLGTNILGFAEYTGSGGNPLSNINPADIESIDVLKDADATAIYGSRGANGVVLITTKKGKAGKLKVDLNMQSGWGKVPHFMDLLDRRQYLDMRYEAFKNDGVATFPISARDLTTWDTTRYTDWQKELIGGTAHYNDVQASLSGGNANTQYLFGTGYHKETTVFPGDFNNQRSSLHLNLNSSSSDKKFRVLLVTNYSLNNNRITGDDLTRLALVTSPVAPAIYNDDGSYNWVKGTFSNPVATYTNRKYNSEVSNLITNAMVSYEIFKGLEIKSSFGYTNIQTNENRLEPAVSKYPGYWPFYGTGLRKTNFLNSRYASWIIEPQVTYSTNIDKGLLSVLVGATIQENKSNGQQTDAEGYSSDLLLEDPKAASIVRIGGSNYTLYKYNAIFGRIGYNWQEKYLINLTARRDGTSRFGPANRFHNFGAAGIGWVFSKEKFLANSFRFLSFGKLRASYGTTGNQGVGDYSFLDLYSSSSVGVPYQGITGLQLDRLYTPDLQWEETKKIEAGLELGFLRDRIVVTVNHYHNSSSNQLVGYSLPFVSGFTSIATNLDAKVENKGWEFSLNTININKKNFRWTSNFNLFWNRNKLVSVSPGMANFYTKFLGKSLYADFIYKFGGVNDTTGQYQFYNYKGDLTYDPSGATDLIVYKDRNPKFSGGLHNTMQFKSFQLDFFLHFVKQEGPDYLFQGVPGTRYSEAANQPVAVLNRWKKPGDRTIIQRYSQDFSLESAQGYANNSDQRYMDVSFIRLKNVSLSWQLPQAWKKSVNLQNARLFMQGQNLLTFTKYHGMDPENLSGTSLPPLRVITIGIQATF